MLTNVKLLNVVVVDADNVELFNVEFFNVVDSDDIELFNVVVDIADNVEVSDNCLSMWCKPIVVSLKNQCRPDCFRNVILCLKVL
jgi:hypothetical protein